MTMDADDFPTPTALHNACRRQVAVAHAALALLRLMDGAGDFGAEGLFDDSRKSVADSLHDTVRVDCLALGNIAKRAGYAIGDELHALARQLDVDWTAKFDAARMAAAVMVAAQ
jgi:hypothetical protein